MILAAWIQRLYTVGSITVWLVGGAALGWALAQGIRSAQWPVQVVQVVGPFVEVSPARIEQAVWDVARGHFLTVSLSRIAQRVMDVPWVYQVSVVRQWPDTIRIQVQEQTVVARWGTTGLLTKDGQIFYPDCMMAPQNWPVLTGPPDEAALLWSTYRLIAETLQPLHVELAALTLSDRRSWVAQLRAGPVLYFGKVGKKRLFSRLARFSKLCQQTLQDRWEQVAYIDLRYPQGVAVGWKAGAQQGGNT